jgi:GTP-binding protein HflX
VQRRDHLDPATLVGSGKAREIADLVKELDAKLVLVLNDLRPRQRKNLEKVIPAKANCRSSSRSCAIANRT